MKLSAETKCFIIKVNLSEIVSDFLNIMEFKQDICRQLIS